MKTTRHWILAAILTCGLQVVTLTSCVDLADNPIYVMLSLLDKMWACSKNVPKMMSAGEEARYEYDCTLTGDRITTFHSHALAQTETVFNETTSSYDIEYLE